MAGGSTLLEAVRTPLAHAGRYNPGEVVARAAVTPLGQRTGPDAN